jgi:hypothetical protein
MLNNSNGLLVEASDESALVLAMEKAYLEHHQWDRIQIANAAAEKYSMNAVAGVLDTSYRNLIDLCAE